MLEYYLPGLDVSSLSDKAYTTKVAQLLKIREMESEGQLAQHLNNLFK